jgi:High potential iron-sulfur protein
MRSFSFSVSRRGWLRAIGALGGLALGTALDARAEDSKSKAAGKKYTKERVGYRDEPYLGRTCAKCVLYSGDGNCAIVDGQVSPDGWCTQWMPATVGHSGSHTEA